MLKITKRATRTQLATSALTLAVTGAFLGPVANAAPPQPVVSELMEKALPHIPGKDALMLIVDYPPGAQDPVHRHNAYGFVYVLEGSIVMQVRGGKEVTLTAGQTFYEGPEDVHTVGRNASKTKPARFLVTLIKQQGAPALIPVK